MPTPNKPTKPRNRRLTPEERREQILEAARAELRESGFQNTTIEGVALRAGVTRGLINHYFGGKYELYVSVVKESVTTARLPVPTFAHSVPIKERIQETAELWMKEVESNRLIWLESVITPIVSGPEIFQILEEARERSAIQAARLFGMSSQESLSAHKIALLRSWMSLVEGVALQWLYYQRLTKDEAVKIIVETGVRASGGLLNELDDLIETDSTETGS